ncbi:uncharacterized protein [Procambarus clarkii]|uniref:uncharacterized protein n=1 Tax=Procambarus clarkii TaxID=6728 RepID=UPI003743370F
MAERPPIIRIRCEGSEDECCSSGGEEVAAQWGLVRAPAAPDKRHSAPEVRALPVVALSTSTPRLWLAPQGHSAHVPGSNRYSLPQLLARSPAAEKRASAPSCLAPPPSVALYPSYTTSPSSYYSSRRCSLDDTFSGPDDQWHYRRLCRLNRRRFSDTARLDWPGIVPNLTVVTSRASSVTPTWYTSPPLHGTSVTPSPTWYIRHPPPLHGTSVTSPHYMVHPSPPSPTWYIHHLPPLHELHVPRGRKFAEQHSWTRPSGQLDTAVNQEVQPVYVPVFITMFCPMSGASKKLPII